jgi:hypothetical protein
MVHKAFARSLLALSSSIDSRYRRYRLARRESRRLRKLQRLRHGESEAGYSLKQFDDYRCIFVHIPKCAGVSICRSLFGNLGAGHHTIASYREIFTEEEFDSYFKFAFVRNPWDRLVSAYFFLKGGGFHAEDKRWAQENLSEYADFDSFVKQWLNRGNARSWIHFRPQHEFLCTDNKEPQLDFIGHYENLADDFARVRARLGINAELQYLNSEQGGTRDYRRCYNEETIQRVADVYREDIQCFGYDFDNTFLARISHQNTANNTAPSSSR